jgi:uncharacterized protein
MPVTGEVPGVRVGIEDKVHFLSDPAAYGLAGVTVEVIETHMSWVFLAGEHAYKMKKPVRYPFLDFSTLSAREANCKAELALNGRLASGVYLRVAALTMESAGALALDGEGVVVEWVVVMRRLPKQRMLDGLLSAGAIKATDVDRLADVLVHSTGEARIQRFHRGHILNGSYRSRGSIAKSSFATP